MQAKEFTDGCERISHGQARAATSFSELRADRHDESSTSDTVCQDSTSNRFLVAPTVVHLLGDIAESSGTTTTWIEP